jgi:hypothetical protein
MDEHGAVLSAGRKLIGWDGRIVVVVDNITFVCVCSFLGGRQF